MSAQPDDLFRLVDYFKTRRRGFPSVVDAVPEDALPRQLLRRTPDAGFASPQRSLQPAPLARPPVSDAGMIPAPIEPPLTRSRVASPEEMAAAATRSRIADPLRYRADRVSEMETEGLPTRDNNGRPKSIGLGAWRGFQRGGLFGALLGAVDSGVNPERDEQEAYAANLGRERGLLSDAYGRRKGLQDLESEAADTALKRVRAIKELQPPKPEYDRIEGVDEQGNPAFFYQDKSDPTAPPVRSLVRPKVAERNLQTQVMRDEKGVETLMQYNPTTKVWEAAPVAGGKTLTRAPKVDETVEWRLSDGRTVRISPSAAASADAAAKGQTLTATREADRIAREDARRADDEAARIPNDNRERATKANKVLAEFRRLKQEAVSGVSPDESKYGTTQQYRERSKAEMMALLPELQSYSDMFNFNNNAEWPDAAPRQVVSVSEAQRQQRGKSRAQIVDEIRAKGYVPVP